ncbi:MAG: energy-coupling factor transporter ATPase [Bacillales bacterium]|nr:energy-coupling factor transporter ATPase [Bacillales bacterium]MDY5920682.1 energy-coupling factor transporter ATPase [Candidatus Enteromonas sp.]
MPIIFRDVCYSYTDKNPMDHLALSHLSFTIETGSFTALVGRTGCGKSTLVQQINALFHPLSGEVEVDGYLNSSDKKKRTKKNKELRKKVGLVFQFPEYQLFEESVLKDVVFGPKNFGASKEEALAAAKEALALVGLDESFYERSPFELSGGEKRRVAIAGILACHPEYLIVDEPTAGLDPKGSQEMMDLFEDIHRKGTTIILVTHDMNLVLRYCDRVLVLEDGKLVADDKPSAFFQQDMDRYSLETPALYRFLQGLEAKGLKLEQDGITDVDSLAEAIVKARKPS